MKDKKELLETKLELNDQQLDKVGGGLIQNLSYYAYCSECGWMSNSVFGDEVYALIEEHKRKTGHTRVRERIS